MDSQNPATAMRFPTVFPIALCIGFLAVGLAQPVSLNAVPNAYQGDAFPELLPVPQEMQLKEGYLPLDGLSIWLEGAAPQLVWATRDLNAEVKNRFAKTLPVGIQTPQQIRIGTIESPALAEAAKTRNLMPDRPEGYALWVEPSGATVVGFDAPGAYRGTQTLRQLLGQGGFKRAQIRDWPAFPVRMAMIYLDKDSQRINDVLIPLLAKHKFNQVLVMCDYVQWNASKSLWHPSGASRAEAERVAKLIRENGMEPIPLIETLGHAQWLFYNPQTNQYDANRDLWADPDASRPFAYDPTIARVYDLILPVLSEAVEVFKPKVVHIGHDEVSSVNRFAVRPEAAALGLPKLFVDDTLRLYNHLKGLGVATMIWHDIAFADAYRDQIAPNLPTDIKVAYWNYSAADDYPPLKTIADLGFSALGSSWFNPGNPEAMTAAALKYSSAGLLQTRWSGYFGNATIYDGQAEQAVAYLNAAGSFWNPQAAASRVVQRYRDAWRPQSFNAVSGQLVDLLSAVTRKLSDPDETQWIQKGPSTDLSKLPTGVVQLGPYAFNISGAVMLKGARPGAADLPQSLSLEFPSGTKAKTLVFLHATGWISNQRYEKIGSYTLTYADGSKATLSLEYGRHLTSWADPSVRTAVFDPVWRGETPDGLSVGLNALPWNNPKPDLEIKSLTLESTATSANLALIGLTLLDALPQEASR